MGIPTELAPHRLHAARAPAPPAQRLGQGLLQGPLQGGTIGHIHQQPVSAALQDLAGAAIVGGHQRQPRSGSLQQGETKGFGEGRIHKHPPQPSRPAV